MMTPETLETRCKRLQGEQDLVLPETGWTIFHLDGRKFGNYRRALRLKQPFDEKIESAMIKTAMTLAEEVYGCILAYTQSDEITLICPPCPDPWFGGRIWKLCSVTSSIATGAFEEDMTRQLLENAITEYIIENDGASMPVSEISKIVLGRRKVQFDCKVWKVDSIEEAYAWVSFRNIDCIRNSVSGFARSIMKHSELLGKTTDELKDMLIQSGKPWDLEPESFKYGKFCIKEDRVVETPNGIATRRKWRAIPGFPLTGQAGRERFMPLLQEHE